MEKDKSQLNIVDSHRNMLMVSKHLSEFQIQNMKQWPFVFLNGVGSVKVHWNFIKKNKEDQDEFYPGEVEYEIEMESTSDIDINVGLIHLELSTKLMFWSDTTVKFKVNGKLWKLLQKSSNTKKTSQKKKTKASKSTSKAVAQA